MLGTDFIRTDQQHMYLKHWRLDVRPFDNSSDPRFYYPGESQQAALLKLRYAVENRHGAAVLAGAAGLGKSFVAQALLHQLEESFQPRARIVFPQMPADQLLAYIADEWTGEATSNVPSVRESVRRIETLLHENSLAGRHALLVIDESHLLRDGDSLQALRLLLNFESASQSPFTLLLVGQSSLLPVLEHLPDFDQRLGAKCILQRFEAMETAAYVEHRLKTAGADRSIFDDGALDALHHHAHGVPRKINRLADLALLVGYAEERRIIQAEQIAAVAEELVGSAAA